jgi:hypothetical protein
MRTTLASLFFCFAFSARYHAFNFTIANYVMGYLLEKKVAHDDAIDLLTVLTAHRHWSLTWALGWDSLKVSAVQYLRRQGKQFCTSSSQAMISGVFGSDLEEEEALDEDFGEGCENDLIEDDERVQLNLEQEVTSAKMCMDVGDHDENECLSGQEDDASNSSSRIKKKVIRASPAATAGTGRPFNERFNVKAEAKKVWGPRKNLNEFTNPVDRATRPTKPTNVRATDLDDVDRVETSTPDPDWRGGEAEDKTIRPSDSEEDEDDKVNRSLERIRRGILRVSRRRAEEYARGGGWSGEQGESSGRGRPSIFIGTVPPTLDCALELIIFSLSAHFVRSLEPPCFFSKVQYT